MKRLLPFVLFAAMFATNAHGAPAGEALQQCLVKSTTAGDREVLIRWAFVAFAQHPSLADVISVDVARRTQVEKDAGRLFERLLAEDCTREMKASFAEGDRDSSRKAFETVGELAMGGFAEDPKVRAALARLMENVDMNHVMRSLMKP